MRTLTGRDQVLQATGHAPYARFATAMAANITGLADGDGGLWVGDGPLGRLAHAGDPESAVDALTGAAQASALEDASWINLPRRCRDRVPAGFEVREEWELRWNTQAAPGHARCRRSTMSADPSAPVVGVIGAVAFDPAYRQQGLGAAVSAAVTNRLRAAHELVTLGVMEGNDGATRIYQRLGYTGVAQITSLWVRTPEPGHTGG